MKGAGSRGLGWIAVLAVAASGCRPSAKACFVTGVSVADVQVRTFPLEDLSRDDLRVAALTALGRTAGFEVPPAEPRRGARTCRASAALLDARVVPEGGAARVEVLVGLSLSSGEDAEGIRETARYAEAVQPGERTAQAFRRALAGAASRAAASLALALAEADKPTGEVIRDLESGDPRMRDLAVRVLADRRSPAAVPALLQRLSDPDPEVVERAVGALAQIRDPRAVGPLIGLTHRREGSFVTQLVLIIGDIGGPEAEAYLETLAAGHPDPAVRKAAQESLTSLRGRSASPPAGSRGR